MMKYTVIFEKGPTSWGAYVPDLPGVITVGDSRDEVERLTQEAIKFHPAGMREKHLPIPSRQGSRDWSKSIRPPDNGPSRHVRGLGVLHPSARSTSPKAVL